MAGSPHLPLGSSEHRLCRKSPHGLLWSPKPGHGVPVSSILSFSVEDNNFLFSRSTKWLGQIKCPVMILHPDDDATIPVELSRKLYNEAVKCGKKDLARVTFDKKFEYGHSGLWEHEGLMDFADKFWKGSIEYNDSQSVKKD